MSQVWRKQYQERLLSAAEAVAKIHPGARVFIGSACGEPRALVNAMVHAADHLADTELIHVLTLGVAPYADPRYAANFRANAFFIGNSLRQSVNAARADYTPIFLSQVPNLFRSRQLRIDVAMITVSPPDDHGYVSLGVSVDITKPAALCARVLIGQVNRLMPRTHGDSMIHISQFHHLVEHDEPLLEWPFTAEPDDITRRIAEHIARLVPDGATLQLGIGHVPDAVLGFLTAKKDLGIHSETFSDNVMILAKAGVITGKHKALHRGKIVGSFALGGRALFDFIHNNPLVEMHPSDYVNDPRIVAEHPNMIAINSALEVDLTGQVCADSLGEQFYSGIGGHADFMRGAALAKGGKPIIAMPSTAMTGEGCRSRITASLTSGAGVITTRGDVHYVVTEYGVAYLHGKSLRERAMSLINIAHPDFRGELLHAAKHRHLVYPDQILPAPTAPPPAEFTSTVILRDGSSVVIRPMCPDDEPLMKQIFYSFSKQTIYLRFHHAMRAMPHQQLQVFCNVDHDTEVALVAVVGPPEAQEMIATARYFTDPSKTEAELAFAVHDTWQRKGLGTILFNRLLEIARSRGIERLVADVLLENSGMLKIFHRSGLKIQTTTDAGVVHVEMQVPEAAAVR